MTFPMPVTFYSTAGTAPTILDMNELVDNNGPYLDVCIPPLSILHSYRLDGFSDFFSSLKC